MNKKDFNRHIVERLFLSWKYFLIFSLIVNFFFSSFFFVSPVAGSLIFSSLENSGFALCVLAEGRFARVYFHDLSSYHLQKKKKTCLILGRNHWNHSNTQTHSEYTEVLIRKHGNDRYPPWLRPLSGRDKTSPKH